MFWNRRPFTELRKAWGQSQAIPIPMFMLVVAALVVDQLNKVLVEQSFALGDGYPLVLGFYLPYVRNTGAAFGIFQERTPLLGVLSAIFSFGLFVYLLLNARTLPTLPPWGLTFFLSGAVGNMLDRLRLGHVVGFIHFQIPGFSSQVYTDSALASKVKKKVAPLPSSPSAQIRPPCRSIMRCTVARPMPVPSNSSACRR